MSKYPLAVTEYTYMRGYVATIETCFLGLLQESLLPDAQATLSPSFHPSGTLPHWYIETMLPQDYYQTITDPFQWNARLL